MAAHLRSIIRRYDGGNHFSPPFSQLSAARPFCSSSSSSIPCSPDQAAHPRRGKYMWEYVRPAVIVTLIFSFCQGIDVMGIRTIYSESTAEEASEGRKHMLADAAMMQRDIDTIKMRRSGRGVDKNETRRGWSAFKMW